jgi:hypothetical protein
MPSKLSLSTKHVCGVRVWIFILQGPSPTTAAKQKGGSIDGLGRHITRRPGTRPPALVHLLLDLLLGSHADGVTARRSTYVLGLGAVVAALRVSGRNKGATAWGAHELVGLVAAGRRTRACPARCVTCPSVRHCLISLHVGHVSGLVCKRFFCSWIFGLRTSFSKIRRGFGQVAQPRYSYDLNTKSRAKGFWIIATVPFSG